MGGLSIFYDNTFYAYSGLQPFSLAPAAASTTADNVNNVFPVTIPYNPLTQVIFMRMVIPSGSAPSLKDQILFQFIAEPTVAGTPHGFTSDQLYTILVYDTVQNESKAVYPFDSAKGVVSIPIPDIPVAGKARIVVGCYLATAPKPIQTTNTKDTIWVNGIRSKAQFAAAKERNYDTSIVVDAGDVKLLAHVGTPTDTDVPFEFNAEAGGIYEAFLVGQRGRPDAAKYGPRWIVVRVNPY